MYPYLFDWVVNGHHFSPPTYGILLAIGFSCGYFEAIRRTIKLGEDPKHIENLFLIVVLASVTGSRLFHVFFEEWSYYAENPWKIFAVWEGGYTFYGAMLAATFAIFVYCHMKKLSFRQYTDISTPSVTLGLAIGRVGCFAAGCCWGRPTHVPWAVTFTNPNSFTTARGIPVHPTQLYEAFGALCIFLYLEWLFPRRKYEGQIFFQGLFLYSILRFIVEIYRGDDYRGFVFGGILSYSQLVSVVILPFVVLGMVLYSRNTHEPSR